MNDTRTTFRKYFEKRTFVDRFASDREHAVDVIIPILHTNEIWRSNLLSIYREIPVNRLLLGDGGCVDDTIEVARKFPRVHVFDHKAFISLGYSIRKLIEEVDTEWFIYLHSDIFLPEGWFNAMCAGKDKYDWFECGQNVTVMVQYVPPTLEVERAYSGTQMGRKDAFAKVLPKIDDDFLYRNEDIIFANLIKEAGFRYGKVRDVFHDHQLMFKESPWLRRIKRATFELEVSKEEEIRSALTYVKGIVKYLKPEGAEDLISGLNENLLRLIQLEAVDPTEFAQWVAKTNLPWSSVFPLPEPPVHGHEVEDVGQLPPSAAQRTTYPQPIESEKHGLIQYRPALMARAFRSAKHFRNALIGNLNLRVVRASNHDQLLGRFEAIQADLLGLSAERDRLKHNASRLQEERDRLEQEASRLQEERDRLKQEAVRFQEQASSLQDENANLLRFTAALRAAEEENETTDYIALPVADDAPFTWNDFIEVCRSYTKLRSISARAQLSRRFIKTATMNSAVALLESPANEVRTHELYRQMAAAVSFSAGRLGEAVEAFKALCNEIPTAINFTCYARTLAASNDQRNAFKVLADAVDRFPLDVHLALELSTFFHRFGDVEAANAALNPVRHAFLEDRNALKPRQEELDRAIDEGRLGYHQQGGDEAHSVVDTWWAQMRRLTQHNEFQDALVARDVAIRHAAAHLMREAAEEATCVIEFGTLCGHGLIKMAQEMRQVQFIGLSFMEAVNDLNERLLRAENLTFVAGDLSTALNSEILGTFPILFHTDVASWCYPALLAQLYAQCRKLGIRHLIISEDLDFDRVTLSYHEPCRFPSRARIGADGRFLHDFQALLEAAGYVISETLPVRPILVPDRSVGELRLLHATLQA